MIKPNEMTFSLILAAAGKSSRFSQIEPFEPTVKKTFISLDGKPVWLRSLEKFTKRGDVIQAIVVVAPEDISWFRQCYTADIDRLSLVVTAGGENRVDSIRNGLTAVTPQADFVAIHDAARPCVTEQEIENVFAEAKRRGAALLASPVVGTIKRVVEGQVDATVPREYLWEAQTPQVFRRELILKAYQQSIMDVPTDDAQVVEWFGQPVYIVPADRGNVKITTPSDLVLAKYLIENGR